MKRKSNLWLFATLALVFVVLWGVCNATSLASALGVILNIVSPVIAGLCIAFILNIPLRIFERLWVKWFSPKHRILRRAVCIVLCLLFFAGCITFLLALIIPEIISTIKDDLWVKIPTYIGELRHWYGILSGWLSGFSIELPAFNITSDGVMKAITKYVSENRAEILNQSVNIAANAAGFIFDSICAFVISIYVLAEKETLGRQARKVLYGLFSEKNADRALTLSRLTEKTFSKFITGQLTEAVILGTLCFVGMLIFRIPYALIVSVCVAVTALIPIFGPFIGTGIGAVLILFESPLKALWFVIFIVILQQIEGNIIYPKVVGSQVGLPGLWVIVAVTIGAEFGIVGMLIAVPLASLIYTVLRQVVNAKLKNKGIDGMFEDMASAKKQKKKKKRKNKKRDEKSDEIQAPEESVSKEDTSASDGTSSVE